MNAGRHAAGDASFARSAGGAMTRGIVLIVVAVLIGIVLIRTAVPDSGDIAAAGPADTTADAVTTTAPTETPDTTSATADTTETTAGEAATPTSAVTEDTTATTADGTTDTSADGGLIFDSRENNLVSVQIANTTTTGGAAGRQTDAFKEEGYTVKKATNWSDGVLSKTKIHHIDGFLPEARKVAEFLGLDPNEDVFFMPATPEAKIGEFQDPDILVLLGSDLAT